MSVRSTSSTSQRPHPGDKHKSPGWAWSKTARGESQKSKASTPEVSAAVDGNIVPNPAYPSALAGKVEDRPPTSRTPSTASIAPETSSDSQPDAVSMTSGLHEDNRPRTGTPIILGHFTDPSSSHETLLPDRPSTPSSPKIFQWEAAKKPQVHSPTTNYRSERTSVADAARRLESLDQASNPTTGRFSGVEQGLHSALTGVPSTLAQILALPRSGREHQSSGAMPPPDEAEILALEGLEESRREEVHPPLVPTESLSHDQGNHPITEPDAFLQQDKPVMQESEVSSPTLNHERVDDSAVNALLEPEVSSPILDHQKEDNSSVNAPLEPSTTEAQRETSPEPHRRPSRGEEHPSSQPDSQASSIYDGEQISGLEQSSATDHQDSMPIAREKTLGEPHNPESEPRVTDLPNNETPTAAPEPLSADQHDEPSIKTHRSFFHRFSMSEGHKTHAERKEEQKKKVKEESASVARAVADTLQKHPSRKESLPEPGPVTGVPSLQEAGVAQEAHEASGYSHEHEPDRNASVIEIDRPTFDANTRRLKQSTSDSSAHDSLYESSIHNPREPADTGLDELTIKAPELPLQNPLNSTISNESIPPPLPPRPPRRIPYRPSHELIPPRIVVIRATEESREALDPENRASTDTVRHEPHSSALPHSGVEDRSSMPAPFSNNTPAPGRSSTPAPAPSTFTQRSSDTRFLLEELGNLEVPIQGRIPKKARIIRKGRCVVLRGPLLQMLLGRELARQTKPVLRLMAHGVEVQPDEDGNLQLAQPRGASTTPEEAGSIERGTGTSQDSRGGGDDEHAVETAGRVEERPEPEMSSTSPETTTDQKPELRQMPHKVEARTDSDSEWSTPLAQPSAIPTSPTAAQAERNATLGEEHRDDDVGRDTGTTAGRVEER